MMRLIRTALVATAISGLASTAACNPADSTPQASSATPGPIERCMNLSNALEARPEGVWGYTIKKEDLQSIAAVGFDTVRMPVRVSVYAEEEPPYTIDRDLIRRMDEVIGWAQAEGLNIILDIHHYEDIYEDPDTETPRLMAMWEQLANHYADAPDSLIFEILNEPRDELDVPRTDALMTEALEVIRRTNPNRWVIVGSSDWGTLDAWLESDPPIDPRVIGTFHYYSPFKVTHQGASWMSNPPPAGRVWGGPGDHGELREDFEKAGAKAQELGVPVFVGEFGVYSAAPPETRAAWVEAVRSNSEAQGFSWCHWGLATGFGIYDDETGVWNDEMLGALGLSSR